MTPAEERSKATTRRYGLSSCVITVVLAACSGPGTSMSGGTPVSPQFVRATTGVPSCDGQNTKKRYGAFTARLKRTGGSFCIPAFAGFGGSIQYPRVDRSTKLTIRTSLDNIYDEPELGSGTSIVYLNLHFHAGEHFGKKAGSAGGLTSQAIAPGDPYTAFGTVTVGHLALRFPPCYSIATQGTYGGVFPNLGNLFSSITITGAGYGVVEIYPGQQVSQEC